MKTNLLTRALLGLTLTIGIAGVPADAAAHCCRTLARIRLAPADPTATPRLGGTASVIDCFGVVSLLNVSVSGIVPDGASYAPAIQGTEPLLGDFFTMTRRHGEGWILDVSLPTVQGRPLVVFDQSFTPVLTGQF